MTLHTLIIIVLSFWGLLLFAGIIFIAVYLGRQSVRDKADKGAVFVKTGLHVKGYKANRIGQSKDGDAFMYGKEEIIFLPRSYQEHYFRDRRLMFVNNAGQMIASPFNDDEALTEDAKRDLIYEMVTSHIGADGMRALKGNKSVNVFIYCIIAFVIGAACVLGFNQMQQQMKKQQAINQPTQQQGIQITPNTN